MTNTTLMGLMDAHAPKFSKGQRRIADYITHHYDEAAFMTAAKLGEEVGVSESTVVRFATELGFDGYPQFQKALQELIRSKLTIVQRLDVTRARMQDDEVLKQVALSDTNNIRRTIEDLDDSVFYDTVDRIVNARQVYVFGAGSCKHLAGFLTHYLQLLVGKARRVTVASPSQICEQMIDLSPEDVVIGISFPRYSKISVQAMHYANQKGACVVALTDSKVAPIAAHADELLIAQSDMISFVDSLVAPLSIINAIVMAVSRKKQKEVTERLRILEEVWDRYEVYDKKRD